MDATLLFGAVFLSIANLTLAGFSLARRDMKQHVLLAVTLALAALSVLCTSATQLDFLQRKYAGLGPAAVQTKWFVMAVQFGAALFQFLFTLAIVEESKKGGRS